MIIKIYTSEDEKELRRVVENHWLRGSYLIDHGPERPHTYEQRKVELEARFLMHKKAGHTAAMLIERELASQKKTNQKAA